MSNKPLTLSSEIDFKGHWWVDFEHLFVVTLRNNIFVGVCAFCRSGSSRDIDKPCPISIQSLATLHNYITKFKVETPNAILSEEILKSPTIRPLWAGWTELHQKHASRVRLMNAAGPRLEPVKEGTSIVNVNPALFFSKTIKTSGSFDCRLAPDKRRAKHILTPS